MSNNGKPTALQTDGQKATSAFESFLAPEEDTQEEAVIEEAESIEPEIDELEEQDDLGTEELVDEEDLEFDDEEDGEEETEVGRIVERIVLGRQQRGENRYERAHGKICERENGRIGERIRKDEKTK